MTARSPAPDRRQRRSGEALERAGVRVFMPQELDALLAALQEDE